MKASALEFRFRYLLHGVVYAIGFLAPWNFSLHLDTTSTWLLLAIYMSRSGLLSLAAATDALLVVATLCAVFGAALRTWGSAFLGAGIVQDGAMHTGQATDGVTVDGPFRYLRNPLYLGTFIHTLALSFLMPRTGAIWTLVLIGIMQIRLMLAEEAFLTAKLGAPYLRYCTLVPRIIPRFRAVVAAGGKDPNWSSAFLGELYMWGVAIGFIALGWRYNAFLLTQAVLVSFGCSLMARAFIARPAKSA